MHTYIVFSLPSSDHAVQNYFSDDYSNDIDKALCYLIEAYNIAYECGPTQLLQNTSLFIVKANMLKVCYYNQQASEQLETVTKCAYYLGIKYFIFIIYLLLLLDNIHPEF